MPTIASVLPLSGPTTGGTSLTIAGTGFVPGLTVTIGGSPATVSSVTDTTILCVSPPHASGPVDVVVTNPDASLTTLPGGFTYVAPAPVPTSVTPPSGSSMGGTPVSIAGTNFQTGATVTIGGIPASVSTVTSTTIACTTGPHFPGPRDVIVTNPDTQSGTLPGGYTYVDPPPQPTSVSPASGTTAGGTALTIGGTGFQTGATVTVGGVLATVSTVGPFAIACSTGPHVPALSDIVVTNPDAQFRTLSAAYTYVDPCPELTSVSQPTGPTTGGTPLVVAGTGFQAGATVTIGGTLATVSTVGSFAIACTTPPHAAGVVDILVTNPDAQSDDLAGAFTFVDPPPVPTSVLPVNGPTAGGTPITITGSAFLPGATVTVGGTPLVGTTVTPTAISGTTSANIAGVCDIVVTNPGGGTPGTLPAAFTYADPAPVPTSVVPPSGPTSGGTPVMIGGSGFQSGATVTIGGAAATVTTVGPFAIACTTGPHVAGVGDVAVNNPDGLSNTLPAAFTYVDPPPVPTFVSPSTGSSGGGTPVIITGTGFKAGLTVTIGGVAATVTAFSAFAVACTTGPHAAGLADIVVTNTDGQSRTLPAAFTYVDPPPMATAATPSHGPSAGGTLLVITGSGFQPGATVTCVGVPAIVTAVTPTSIACTTGPGAPGIGDVVVMNPDGRSSVISNGFTYDPLIVVGA